MSKSLNQWLTRIESYHPDEIELGLERCSVVFQRLVDNKLSFPVITVAGTNGKGSTVAVLEALAIQANKKPLVYTSPHFLDYRERLRYDGDWLSEQQHIDAFQSVETARQNQPLTYFEFATLSALKCAEQLQPDLLILETGLGGRLDAVNVIAADIAIITTVDFDHQNWLGDDLESIAREKAGIIHHNKIAIIADPEFPQTIINEIKLTTDKLYLADNDFYHIDSTDGWSWQNSQYGPWLFTELNIPSANISAAIQAWSLLADFPKLTEHFIHSSLKNIDLAARFELVATEPNVILDVAHNVQAFRTQLNLLQKQGCNGKTHLIIGMLQDKDILNCIDVVKPVVDQWYFTDLPSVRGYSATHLKNLFNHSEIDQNRLQCYSSPVEAYREALERATTDDRIVITGSFFTVAPVLALYREDVRGHV